MNLNYISVVYIHYFFGGALARVCVFYRFGASRLTGFFTWSRCGLQVRFFVGSSVGGFVAFLVFCCYSLLAINRLIDRFSGFALGTGRP